MSTDVFDAPIGRRGHGDDDTSLDESIAHFCPSLRSTDASVASGSRTLLACRNRRNYLCMPRPIDGRFKDLVEKSLRPSSKKKGRQSQEFWYETPPPDHDMGRFCAEMVRSVMSGPADKNYRWRRPVQTSCRSGLCSARA